MQEASTGFQGAWAELLLEALVHSVPRTLSTEQTEPGQQQNTCPVPASLTKDGAMELPPVWCLGGGVCRVNPKHQVELDATCRVTQSWQRPRRS